MNATQAPAVLVVQNTPTGGPRRVGERLRAAGIRLDLVRADAGQPLPEELGHRALVVLGGGYLPDEDDRAPWLARTRVLTAQALRDGVPVLGICLGGQLLAQVAGGTVRGRHGTPEVGSTPIRRRPEAAGDPLFGPLAETTPAIENHVDAITGLPPGAVWLADSETCPHQAFRVGERAWGVQFHPEVPADRLREWEPERLRARGFDPDEVVARAEADEGLAAPAWSGFADRFAAEVSAFCGGRPGWSGNGADSSTASGHPRSSPRP